MKKAITVSLVLGALMLSSAAVTRVLTPTEKIADREAPINLESMVPTRFGHWQLDAEAGANVLPSPDVQANLDKIYDQILSRTYVNERGERIMLTITYGSAQTQDLRAHRQEVCYTAQGFEISDLSHEVMRIFNHNVPVTRMFAQKDARQEPVTYWFTMGNQVVLSRTERFLVQLKYSFSGVIPDGLLVRVSNLTPNKNAGFQTQADFLNELMPALAPAAVTKLLGAEG